MRHLLTSLALLATFAAAGQGVYTYPQWNPDANYSGFIEASDLLSMLTVFSQPWGFNDTASCNYDGTEFESFFGSVIGNDIIIDSLSIQFILSDLTDPYYVPGCPDPLVDSVETFFSFMLQPFSINGDVKRWSDGLFNFEICWSPINGTYTFSLGWQGSYPLANYANQGLYGNGWIQVVPQGSSLLLPFPESFVFDSTGISFAEIGANHWAHGNGGQMSWLTCPGANGGSTSVLANYISHWNMIPFWHYAE